MKNLSRVLKLLAVVCLLAAIFCCLSANAEGTSIVDSGECGDQGDNVTWTLDSNGKLTISGTGATIIHEIGGLAQCHSGKGIAFRQCRFLMKSCPMDQPREC